MYCQTTVRTLGHLRALRESTVRTFGHLRAVFPLSAKYSGRVCA